MTQTVSLPLWAFVLILLFAVVTFASHFLFPSVRWFFRKRAERVIAKLNTRLQRPIEPFKLARRYDMIQRLIYDPDITQAIVDYAAEENVPENVAFEKARSYAREIVPSFSATAYFSVGTRLAEWLSTSLYRIRLGAFDREGLSKLDPNATVIFVMNHRSNIPRQPAYLGRGDQLSRRRPLGRCRSKLVWPGRTHTATGRLGAF